jgi:hypothetical protein
VLIRARAHQLWLEAGNPAGQELDHWLQAEREVDTFARVSGVPRRSRWHWYKPMPSNRSASARSAVRQVR